MIKCTRLTFVFWFHQMPSCSLGGAEKDPEQKSYSSVSNQIHRFDIEFDKKKDFSGFYTVSIVNFSLQLPETTVVVPVKDRHNVAGPSATMSSPKESLSPRTYTDSTNGEINSSNWVVDGSGFLSPAGPVLKEVLDLVDGVCICSKWHLLWSRCGSKRWIQPTLSEHKCLLWYQDIDGWCNLAAFDLPEESPSPERHQFRLEGSALQELSKGSKGELIPISPGGVTSPSILHHRSRRRINLSPDVNNTMTPKSTPVKILPFSPSQVHCPSLWHCLSLAFGLTNLTLALSVPQHVDKAGQSWLRKSISHINTSVQSEGHRYNATAAGQDPSHSEGKLSVSNYDFYWRLLFKSSLLCKIRNTMWDDWFQGYFVITDLLHPTISLSCAPLHALRPRLKAPWRSMALCSLW